MRSNVGSPAIHWLMLVSITTAVAMGIAVEINAQTSKPSCSIDDVTKAASGEATPTAKRNFDCLVERLDALQKEKDILQIQLKELRDVDIVEKEQMRALLPFVNAKGAVVAFDRSEGVSGDASGGACPLGWSVFEPAGGRFIVGASQRHKNTDVNDKPLNHYPAFSDRETGAVGGEETHTLTMPEMPKHRHGLETVLDNARLTVPNLSDTSRHVAIAGIYNGLYKRNFYEGADSPHNNMPPFIALYWCKKD